MFNPPYKKSQQRSARGSERSRGALAEQLSERPARTIYASRLGEKANQIMSNKNQDDFTARNLWKKLTSHQRLMKRLQRHEAKKHFQALEDHYKTNLTPSWTEWKDIVNLNN